MAVEDIQIRAMATVAPQAIQTELEAATTAEAVVEALLSAAKKTLSSSEDWVTFNSKKLNRFSCKTTCNQFAFAC